MSPHASCRTPPAELSNNHLAPPPAILLAFAPGRARPPGSRLHLRRRDHPAKALLPRRPLLGLPLARPHPSSSRVASAPPKAYRRLRRSPQELAAACAQDGE